MLKFSHIVKSENNKKCSFDLRKRADWYVCSYIDELGQEYRKSFWIKHGNKFNPIREAENKELNKYTNIIIE